MDGWGIVGLAAVSLFSAAAPDVDRSQSPTVQLAQVNGLEPAYSQPVNAIDPWYGYKLRLAALARQQGIRETTIEANVPNLGVNQRVIELERTEPIARSSGGAVGALRPYLRSHVTASLVRRGEYNYSDNYEALSRIETRYGVYPAVLLATWGVETS